MLAVFVFALMATFGLPIDTRYAFLASAILCLFCGAGVFGWSALPKGDRRRLPWMAAGGLVLVALLATLPGQVRSAHHQLRNLAHQESIQNDLLAMVHNKAIALKCGPVGVPNHAPIPLLALYLKARPGLIVSAEATAEQAAGIRHLCGPGEHRNRKGLHPRPEGSAPPLSRSLPASWRPRQQLLVGIRALPLDATPHPAGTRSDNS